MTHESADDAMPDAGCLQRIRMALPQLTGARRQVAEAVLRDPWDAQGDSILVLAQKADVSENAVSRFTHSLGYSGYREFAQALSLDLGKSLGLYHVHPMDAVMRSQAGNETSLDLLRRVVAMEIECMQDTLANLSEPVLQHIINSLAGANRILLLGTGTAASLCHLLCYRLTSLGMDASWTSDPMMMVASASRLRDGDVALAVSYSGRSRDTVQALGYARSRGAETIAVTAHPQSPIGEVAGHTLTIFSPAVPEGAAQFSARTAAVALLEAIATAVSLSRGGGDVAVLQELGEAQSTINDLPADWRPET